MANCSICYERFSAPVSLPCGHIFCRDCLRTTVDAIKSPSLEHYCPACRTPYSVVTIDAALVPPYLRPHILPPIRPVFFDHVSSPKIKPVADSLPESLALPKTTTDSSPHSQPSSSGSSFLPTSPSSPSPATSPASLPHTPVIAQSLRQIPEANSSMTSLRRNAAEADALRMACQTWRHRAEVHAAANSGLLSFARAARNAAIKMRGERDDLKRRVEVLQRQLMEVMATECEDRWSHKPIANPTISARPKRMLPELMVDSQDDRKPQSNPVALPAVQVRPSKRGPGLPNFITQQRQVMRATVAARDAEPSLLGPPLKRRRLSPILNSPSVEVA